MSECISIIIPAYNAEEYLENCLDSVLCQTYSNYEILLVDDGSTDDTGVIADRYQTQYSDKLKCFHTENRGVTAARFTGILAAKGEWVGFVDADDEIEPDMYERLYNNACYYEADISHCGYKVIVNHGEKVREFYNTGILLTKDNKDGLSELIGGQFEPGLWNKIYRRELVTEVVRSNEISPSIKYNEDVLMNYYLFKKAHSSVFEDFCGYHYLARPDSAIRKKGFIEKKVLDPVRVHKQILDDVTEEYKAIAQKNYLTACMHAYEALYKQTGYEDKKKELNHVLQNNRDKWYLLRRNDRLKLWLMMASPGLYTRIYHWYENHLQEKQYE